MSTGEEGVPIVDEPVELSDEVLSKMIERPQPTDLMCKLFGEENFVRLGDAMFNQEVFDLDYLSMTGELTREEFVQYSHRLPEFGSLNMEVFEITEAMLEHFFLDKGRVRSWFDRSFLIKRGEGKISFRHDQGLGKFRQMLSEVTKMFLYSDEHLSYRNLLARNFLIKIMSEVAVKFYKLCDGAEYAAAKKTVLDSYFNSGTLPSGIVSMPLLPLAPFVEMRTSLENMAAKYQVEFNDLAISLCQDDADDLASLRQKNLAKAGIAGSLMMFRTCEEIVFEPVRVVPVGKFRAISSGDELYDNLYNKHILVASFHLDPGNDDPDESRLIAHVDFYGDVGVGFLRLENFFDPLSCERLKSRIYDEIIKDLNEKPDKYQDLLIGNVRARKRTAKLVENVKEAVGGVVDDEAISQGSGFGRWMRRGGEFLGRAWKKSRAEPEVAQPVVDIVDSVKVKVDLSKFDNLSGEEVLRIAIRVLGKPVRIAGSHHVFRNLAGKTCPIPIHRGKNVARNTLVSALGALDALEDFYNELV